MPSELGEKLLYLRGQLELFLGPDIGFILMAAPMHEKEKDTDMIAVYNVDESVMPFGLRALADEIEGRNKKEQN